jgi:hypothetical protein
MNSKIRVLLSMILLGMFTPASLVAHTTSPPYLAEMPSVDQVMKAMQTSDPDETAARQMAAFIQLQTMNQKLGQELLDLINKTQ